MAKRSTLADFDAAIVGAGHNALACAAHLARKGWSVGIFEQAERPGGAVKTLELTLPGFRHDWGAMNLGLFAGSGFVKAYGDELERHGLKFAPAEHCFASAFPDGRWIGIGTNLRATLDKIAEFSPEDASVWQRLATEFPDDADQYFSLLGGSLSTASVASLAAGSLPPKGDGEHRRKSAISGIVDAQVLVGNFRIRASSRNACGLGNASRFCARHRGRRNFSLSGIHGMPKLRDGNRQGRSRYDGQGACRNDRGTRRSIALRQQSRTRRPRRKVRYRH